MADPQASVAGKYVLERINVPIFVFIGVVVSASATIWPADFCAGRWTQCLGCSPTIELLRWRGKDNSSSILLETLTRLAIKSEPILSLNKGGKPPPAQCETGPYWVRALMIVVQKFEWTIGTDKTEKSSQRFL